MAAVAQVFDNGVIKAASELKSGSGDKIFFPPTDRNKDVILDKLRPYLDKAEYVLEVGSGSGQHVFHFSKAYPNVVFQPTEYDTSLFKSIDAYTADLERNNRVNPPIELDATKQDHWDNILNTGRFERDSINVTGGAYDIVLATNIFHITSWQVGSSIVLGAGHVLRPGGFFFAYGSFKKDGKFSTESNEEFDKTLRGRNASWGVRDIEALQKVAEEQSLLKLVMIENMPSNNYLLVFQKLETEE
ncbi:hypothetical protein BGZ76_009179 [Entomortierella beljakovae]|nr:hypothetical protein BGZ76_009179 [Entomortierella beljakovae]